MKIAALLYILFFIPVFTSFGFCQDPLPVLKSSWEFSTQKGQQADVPQTGPRRLITADDTMIARTGRDFRTDHPANPSDQTPDGRRDMIEKNEQQAKTPQPVDLKGFTYSATVRNDSSKTVKVIFWEYRFAELSHPENVARRQFLCSVNLKKGSEIDLQAFSTLGPTDTIAASSLASGEKLFDEKIRVNRIEYADDDDILQRGDWKFADVKDAVARATATPWGKEICRLL